MNKNLPITIEEVRFYAYSFDEKRKIRNALWSLDYDGRHDFLCSDDYAGMAVMMMFRNERVLLEPSRGVRHNVTVTLVDATERIEVASCTRCISISRKDYLYITYLDFPADVAQLTGGHTYKLVLYDDKESAVLGEYVFHFYAEAMLGHPRNWYAVNKGGIRPDWSSQLYKSVTAELYNTYYVRFNIEQAFGLNPPLILPELELRLHYGGGDRVETLFVNPVYQEFDVFRCCVEQKFVPGKDFNGTFYAELRCMGYAVAGFVFSTCRDDIPGSWSEDEIVPLDEFTPDAAEERLNRLMPEQEESAEETSADTDEFEEVLDRFVASDGAEGESGSTESDLHKPLLPSLDELTGLRSVKEKLATYERIVRFNAMRSAKGLPVTGLPLHAMFLGSPGTGKTTVAKMMGDMLRRAGILSKGHVVVRERATLLGQNYNSESEKTLAAIEEASGGILFIDEAYQLYQPNDPRDPGHFVVDTLLTALADETRRDWMLILAGYPEEMKRMFDLNPGFKSRIPDSNIYRFDDFSESELMNIAENYLSRMQYRLSPEAAEALGRRLKSDFSCRGKNFGNARHVINMIQTEILPAMAVRVVDVAEATESDLTVIHPADIPASAGNVVPTAVRPRIGYCG